MSGSAAVRGSYAKSVDRRAAILDAAVDVFAGSGYRDGSLREIAERVGMSQAGLLHHFASKAELLAAVLETRDARDRGRGSDLLDSPEGIDGIRAILGILEHNQTVPGLVELHCVLSAEATAPDHPAHDYFVRRYAELTANLTASLDDMRAKGQLREGVEPASAARALVAVMDGLQVQWLLDPHALDMPAEVRAHLGGILTVDL